MYEYAVMCTVYSTSVPHRGPYTTFSEAQNWVDEAVEDGFPSTFFCVYKRPIGPWVSVTD